MVAFHVFVNVGMTVGIMPITGIPLPFISYGGSALMTMLWATALILNIGMRRQKILF
jgi:rod shape determining protein RodA